MAFQSSSNDRSSPMPGDFHLHTNLNNLSLDEFANKERRQALDTLGQLRRLGLDQNLSIPQIVACGDQSSGKSSLLEALTGIPLPRSDGMCTRFATQITMRHAEIDAVRVSIISGSSQDAQTGIEPFDKSLHNFVEVPDLIERAKLAMGIVGDKPAISKDILNIEVEGPGQTQLCVIDIPGLIRSRTGAITKEDIDSTQAMTDFYLKQSRTICLAVLAATSDAATQEILSKVREFDPKGERTIGVITKPDCLSAGSGLEAAYLSLARNELNPLNLGWHVVKNRTFEERSLSLDKRNLSEQRFFNSSAFNTLGSQNVGISSLRNKLSDVLFQHVQVELPGLRRQVQNSLLESRKQLYSMGEPRITSNDCKRYLSRLYSSCTGICRAAVQGLYDDPFFANGTTSSLVADHKALTRRLRARVESGNKLFSMVMGTFGHKYNLESKMSTGSVPPPSFKHIDIPKGILKCQAMEWAGRAIALSRGKELPGTFNPLSVSELLWEQSSQWKSICSTHVEHVSQICREFLKELLEDQCSEDIRSRLPFSEKLEERFANAFKEIDHLEEDRLTHPSTYSREYIVEVRAKRKARFLEAKNSESDTSPSTIQSTPAKPAFSFGDESNSKPGLFTPFNPQLSSSSPGSAGSPSRNASSNSSASAARRDQSSEQTTMRHFSYLGYIPAQADRASCEEALDSVLAIYNVQLNVFIANVANQVIDRHILRGMEKIFSPELIHDMSDEEAKRFAAEPSTETRQREQLRLRIKKLTEANDVLRSLL